MGHVGDSRAYLFRDHEISQLTSDHTFVQSLIDEGRITEADARTHPHRNLILKALDGVHEVDPDLFTVAARRVTTGSCSAATAPPGRSTTAASPTSSPPARPTSPRSSWSAPASRPAAPTTSPASSPTSSPATDDDEPAGPDGGRRRPPS